MVSFFCHTGAVLHNVSTVCVSGEEMKTFRVYLCDNNHECVWSGVNSKASVAVLFMATRGGLQTQDKLGLLLTAC